MMKKFEDQFSVPDLYKKSFIQAVLWAWITALRSSAGYSRKDAIESFKQFFACDQVDELNLGTHYTFTNRFYMKDFKADIVNSLNGCADDRDAAIVSIDMKLEQIKKMLYEDKQVKSEPGKSESNY